MHKIGNLEHGFIPHEDKVTHITMSEQMRDLCARVESALVIEKDDSPDFCTKPSLIQALLDQIKNLQGQLDYAEHSITNLRTIILNIKNEARKVYE